MDQIEQHTGRSYPLHTIFQASTISALAAALDADTGLSTSIVRPLQPLGVKPPLIGFHPAGGHVIAYRDLVTCLGPKQPFYGVQSRVCSGAAEEVGALGEMARDYAAAICQHQPEGPYSLLGWSMGGVIALAAAHALEARGESVAFVGLIDSYLPEPGVPSWTQDPLLTTGLSLGGGLASALIALDVETQDALRQQLHGRSTLDRLQQLTAWGQSQQVLPDDLPPAQLAQQAKLVETHLNLLHGCHLEVVQAPLFIWWAQETFANRPPWTDWQRYTRGPCHIATTPGSHFSLLQPPHVNALATRVQASLIR